MTCYYYGSCSWSREL